MAADTTLARPGGVCEVCGAAIDRRSRFCRPHSRQHLTSTHQRDAAEKRWSQAYKGEDMTVIQAAPIAPYEGPSWLVEMTGPWQYGTRAVGSQEHVKVLDRTIAGWGPANAIIEVTNRDGWRRHMLAELRDEAIDTSQPQE